MYRELGEAAWAWVLSQVRDDDGPWLPEIVPDDGQPECWSDRDSVYAGIGGLALVLAEISQYRRYRAPSRHWQPGSSRGSPPGATWTDPSLYTGLGGDVTALKLIEPGSEQVALRGWPS